MPQPLPSFASPPVTEVVIASRFKPAEGYSMLTVADLARSVGARGYAVIEERPGYDAPTERFGAAAEGNQFSLELLAGPPPTRYWFLNDLGDELFQLQPDWIAANWRKVAPKAEYGRWDSRWDAFSAWATSVELALSDRPLEHEQVEVTYVNHIEPSGVWEKHGDASRVFAFLAGSERLTDGFLADPEQSISELRFVIPDPSGRVPPLGRLHVSVTAGFRRPTNEPIFLMNLTARGRPPGGGLPGVREFAEIAHEWIVRAFSDLTTPAMHEAWQRNYEQEEGAK